MIPFTLYTSPPRQEYLESDTKLAGKRLSDMGWGGGAVVLVKWTDAQAAGPTTSPFLKEELLAIAQPLEPPSMGISAADIEPSASQQKPAGARTLGGDPVPAQGQNAEKKIPKWLKGFSEFQCWRRRKIVVRWLIHDVARALQRSESTLVTHSLHSGR